MLKTRSWKLVTLLLTLVCALFACTGCWWFQKKAKLQEVQAPKLSTTYDEEFHCYDVYVEGIIENLSSFSASVNVTLVLYDAEGNVLEVAYAYVGELGAGERWRYCATTSSVIEPISCRVSEIYGYECYQN